MNTDLILLSFVLVPAIPLAFVRPALRRVLGAIGLGFGLVAQLLLGGGPDSFGNFFPFLGLCLAAAALLGEVMAFLVSLFRRSARDDARRAA